MQRISRILCFLILSILFSSSYSTVRIGVPAYDPPFSVNDPVSGPGGADINLMNEICSRLQWSCEYKVLRYYDLFSALHQNQIDFAIGSLVITSDRQTEFSFSIPYLVAQGSFIVLADSKIQNVADLKGQTVGSLTGRVYIDYLKENFIGQFKVIPFTDQADMVLALQSGKINALFVNHLSAVYLQKQHPDLIKTLPEEYDVGEGLGIATSAVNKNKIADINKVLLQIQSDGTFIKLYNKTFDFIS